MFACFVFLCFCASCASVLLCFRGSMSRVFRVVSTMQLRPIAPGNIEWTAGRKKKKMERERARGKGSKTCCPRLIWMVRVPSSCFLIPFFFLAFSKRSFVTVALTSESKGGEGEPANLNTRKTPSQGGLDNEWIVFERLRARDEEDLDWQLREERGGLTDLHASTGCCRGA